MKAVLTGKLVAVPLDKVWDYPGRPVLTVLLQLDSMELPVDFLWTVLMADSEVTLTIQD